jgi:hypothetical protein
VLCPGGARRAQGPDHRAAPRVARRPEPRDSIAADGGPHPGTGRSPRVRAGAGHTVPRARAPLTGVTKRSRRAN